MLGVAVYRFIVLAQSPGPTGSDGGNWLAFTAGLFGASPKAAASVYFPGTLVMLKFLLLFLAPLAAVKTLAVLSSVLAALPFYFLARTACSTLIATVVTLLFLTAGFLTEMMAWGGYPQLLATAYMLGALFLLDRWLVDGDRRGLYGGAASVMLVVATHHFTALILVAVAAIYLLFIAWQQRSALQDFARRLAVFGGASAALSLLLLPWYLRYMSLLAGEGSLGAAHKQVVHLNEVLSYVFAEAPQTWMILTLAALATGMLPLRHPGARRLRPLAFALTLAPMLVYAFTNESRSFQPMQAGVLLSLGLLATLAMEFGARLQAKAAVLRLAQAPVALAGLGLLLILLPNSHTRFEDTMTRFGALDTDAIEALEWLHNSTPSRSVVLPGARNGWVSYAWWVEGLAQRPAYGLIDPAFLAFKEEQEQSDIAAELIDPQTSPEETRALLRQSGIDYLFIYKPTGGQFQSLADRVPTSVAYQNDEFVILKIGGQEAAVSDTR